MRRIASWVPAVAWAATLYWLSSRPASDAPPFWLLRYDKLTHAIAFGILGALGYFAMRVGHRAGLPRAAFVGWLAAAVYGALDEIHQSFVPTRNPDVYDWLADAIGAAVAVLLLWALEQRLGRIADQRAVRVTTSR